MKKRLKRVAQGILGAALFGTAGIVSADPLESVTGLDVHNPPAFLAALARYNQTNAAQAGNVTIWAVEFSGDSEISHLAIGNYDDYAASGADHACQDV